MPTMSPSIALESVAPAAAATSAAVVPVAPLETVARGCVHAPLVSVAAISDRRVAGIAAEGLRLHSIAAVFAVAINGSVAGVR